MERLEQLMDVCGFTKPGDAGIYKHWSSYIDDVAAYAVKSTRPRAKKQAMMLLGIYSLFIEFLAGRLPETLDEAGDGAVYMSRAAIEFRDRFIKSTLEQKDERVDIEPWERQDGAYLGLHHTA